MCIIVKSKNVTCLCWVVYVEEELVHIKAVVNKL